MTLAASRDMVGGTRRRGESNGATFWLTTFLGDNRFTVAPDAPTPSAEAIYPVAFLVEQDPSSTVQSHFHQADQFQVIVGGSATLATHAVRDLSVHFAGAYSPYGPIRATDQGVDYFTLRNGWDPGARYMPGARDVLRAQRRARHREAVAPPQPTLSPDALARWATVASDELIAQESDGLAAWRYRLPPNATVTGSDPRASRGQIWLVVGGSAAPRGDAPLPTSACLFVFPHEAPLAIAAGASGAELLCLQYPRTDA